MQCINKKLLSLVTIVIIFFLIGCSGSSPSQFSYEYIQSIKVNDLKEALNQKSNLKSSSEVQAIIKESLSNESGEQIIESILKQSDYIILSEDIKGDTASVNIRVRGANIVAALSDAKNYTIDDIEHKLKDANVEEREVKINLIKNSDKWEVVKDENVVRLLLGE